MKHFTLRVILTVTTGRLLTQRESKNDNGIGDLYEILDYMTGDQSYTHTRGRFSKECKPYLESWYPELKIASSKTSLRRLDLLLTLESDAQKAIYLWLEWLKTKYGLSSGYKIKEIPKDDHTKKCPEGELEEMIPKNKIIKVRLDGNGDE